MKRLLALTVVWLWTPAPVAAHELRPAYFEIVESPTGQVTVLWKQPILGELALPIAPALSAGWLERYPPEVSVTDEFLIRQWEIPAGASPLVGQTARVLGLEETVTDVLLRVTLADGTTLTQLMKPAAPSLEIGARSSPRTWTYLTLGLHHILLGVDHLLFVLGLLVLVGSRWSVLLKTITAFTGAHSLTLAASTLGVVRIPPGPLNVVVALSIVLVGVEIVRQRRGETSLTIERPWMAAFGFGLIHGFGFASGLSTLGLPRQDVIGALLLFNAGVELGQLVFVALCLGAQRAAAVLELAQPRWAGSVPSYVIGSLGAYWAIVQLVKLVAVAA
jgi:hypothetical protein